MKLTINSKLRMNDGREVPMLGFGTWQISEEKQAEDCVFMALKTGYRHIDTAKIYGNEKSVGHAIKKAIESGISRKDIFVTTKLWNADHTDPEKAFNESLEKLGLEYIDLYLIHWPVPEYRLKTWKVFEKLLETGKVKSIGVSNFTIKHLQELMKNSKIIPVVDQVEFSPWLYQKELLDFCNKNKIILEAYSPLTRGKMLTDKKLGVIAKKYAKSPAQILIRWVLQHNMVVLPKSTHPARIKENANIFDFEISEADMKALDKLDESKRFCWNPEEMG